MIYFSKKDNSLALPVKCGTLNVSNAKIDSATSSKDVFDKPFTFTCEIDRSNDLSKLFGHHVYGTTFYNKVKCPRKKKKA